VYIAIRDVHNVHSTYTGRAKARAYRDKQDGQDIGGEMSRETVQFVEMVRAAAATREAAARVAPHPSPLPEGERVYEMWCEGCGRETGHVLAHEGQGWEWYRCGCGSYKAYRVK
jgi:hypothetical protein